jgi:hypothetical protein
MERIQLAVYGSVASSCEHGNESSVSIKGEEFLNKDCAQLRRHIQF